MQQGPILITGLGLITPLGVGREAYWQQLCAGLTARSIAPEPFGAGAMIASINGFDPTTVLPKHGLLRRLDRFSLLTAAVIQLALADAGIDESLRSEVGLVGNSQGSYNSLVGYMETLCGKGPEETSAAAFANTGVGAAFGFASIFFNLQGAASVLMGSSAVAYAAELIAAGKAERLCVCASHERAPLQYRAYASLGLADPAGQPRPFDPESPGFLYGEAFGAVILESGAAAARRGAQPLARLTGWGEATEPSVIHPTERRRGGPAFRSAMHEALSRANCHPQELGAVFTAAAGLRERDAAEAGALADILSDGSRPLCAVKAQVGETPGAAELIALITAVLGLTHDQVPALDRGVTLEGNHLLINHAELWGPVSSLVIARP